MKLLYHYLAKALARDHSKKTYSKALANFKEANNVVEFFTRNIAFFFSFFWEGVWFFEIGLLCVKALAIMGFTL